MKRLAMIMSILALSAAMVIKGCAVNKPTEQNHGGVRDVTDSLEIEMVEIPAGRFMMGSPESKKGRLDDERQHEVVISKPFLAGRYEVTIEQFRRFNEESGYRTEAEKEGWAWTLSSSGMEKKTKGASWKSPGFAQGEAHPVTCMSI